MAGCGGSGGSSPAQGTRAPGAQATASSSSGPPASAAVTVPSGAPAPTADEASIDPGASGLVAACGAPISILLRQAPELQDQLPDRVANRPLSRWSVRGRCALEMLFGDTEFTVDEVLEGANAAGTPPIEPENIAYAIAGRDDVENDPPYFVYAGARPDDEDEIYLNLFVMLAGAAFFDIDGAARLEGFEARDIAGKDVYVGTIDMLEQTSHQRGLPYLYETEDAMFLVLTDDPAWAAEAFSKLP